MGQADQRNGRVYWKDFYINGKINVVLNPKLLESDEAIVAAAVHELHELSLFRKEFALRKGNMLEQHAINFASPNVPNNFHCQAWAKSDETIKRMRGEK